MLQTRTSRWIWRFALSAIAGIWLVTLTLGWDEITGNAAFALIVSAVLADLSVISGVFLGPRDRRLAAVAWWAVAAGCLLLAVLAASNSDAEAMFFGGLLLLYVMLALSFPLGLIAVPVANGLLHPLEVNVGAPVAITVAWVMFVALGYLQWFKIVPHYLHRRFGQA